MICKQSDEGSTGRVGGIFTSAMCVCVIKASLLIECWPCWRGKSGGAAEAARLLGSSPRRSRPHRGPPRGRDAAKERYRPTGRKGGTSGYMKDGCGGASG